MLEKKRCDRLLKDARAMGIANKSHRAKRTCETFLAKTLNTCTNGKYSEELGHHPEDGEKLVFRFSTSSEKVSH